MAHYRIEIYDESGMTIDIYKIEIPQKTVEEALSLSPLVKRLSREAKQEKKGFRLIRESD